MRFRSILVTGLAMLSVSACAQAERPTQLVGALNHGFTLVDETGDEPLQDAWVVVTGGQIDRRGSGPLPSGPFITEIDLSGYFALDRGDQKLTFLALNPINDMSEGRSATLVMTGGLLSEPTANRAAFNDGADASSPHRF